MLTLHLIGLAGFYLVLFITIAFAILTVSLRNLFHCALCLAGTLLGVASIFLFLRAEFLGMIQILVYVGAVVTIMVFTIMLTHGIADKSVMQNNLQSPASGIALLCLTLLISFCALHTTWPYNTVTFHSFVDAKTLGIHLLTEYAFPFEIGAIILTVALIGAIALGRDTE